MTLMGGFTIYGDQELMQALQQMAQASRAPFLLEVAKQAAIPIMEEAKDNLAPFSETGDLENSVCIGGLVEPVTPTRGTDIQAPEASGVEATVYIGSNHPAARRRELGFIGIDSLGRNVHDPGRPYLRPAFDTQTIEAMRRAAVVARELFLSFGGHP